MYEILALYICTSCLSCICCFVTGALCAIPKLLQIQKDLNVYEAKTSNCAEARQNDGNFAVIVEKKNDDSVKKAFSKCTKKAVIHTVPIAEEDTMCDLRRRDGCSCAPLYINENLHWK